MGVTFHESTHQPPRPLQAAEEPKVRQQLEQGQARPSHERPPQGQPDQRHPLGQHLRQYGSLMAFIEGFDDEETEYFGSTLVTYDDIEQHDREMDGEPTTPSPAALKRRRLLVQSGFAAA